MLSLSEAMCVPFLRLICVVKDTHQTSNYTLAMEQYYRESRNERIAILNAQAAYYIQQAK